MKVLWICGLPYQVQVEALDNQPFGATAAWSWIISHLPPPTDVELHIACFWHGGSNYRSFQYLGATWHLVPTNARHRTITFFRTDRKVLKPLVKDFNPDIIHGWGTEDSYSLLAISLAPKKHVVGIQGLITEYRRIVPQTLDRRFMIIEYIEKYTLRNALKVVVESSYSARITKPLINKAHLWQIDHPLRNEFLESKPSDCSAKNIVYIGTLDDRKGILDALLAFSHLKTPDWTLTVIGQGAPTYVTRVEDTCNTLGISGDVTFIPKASIDQIVTILQLSTIFLLPTKIDTGPTALKEAMSMGVWPVCYDNSGPAGYIRNFKFGALAKNGDVEDLCRTLNNCVQELPRASSDTRASAIRKIRLNLNKDTVWKQLLKVYRC